MFVKVACLLVAVLVLVQPTDVAADFDLKAEIEKLEPGRLRRHQRPPADDEEAEPELSLLESIDALNSRNQQIRERYARLLLRCAAAKSRDSVMLTAAGGTGDSFLNAVDGTNRRPSDRLAAEEGELDAPLRNLVLTAPPSGNAAHYLARAMVLRDTKFHWWSRPLTDHSPICEFELVFPGCLSPSDMFENQQTSAVQGSICSDGSYVYILSVYGLFKMGSGLTETRPGKVFAHNETLRYLDGSLLIYCNESLYLRRSHSTRLWVIERESLREIGEIMLPTALCEGVLYSDGRLFFHGVLDDQWNFVATTLDDNFAPMQAARSHQRVACRLVDIEYTTFGDFGPKLHALLDLIPSSLKSTAVDLQFGGAVGFLLTRNGKVFYAGNGEAFGLANSLDTWIPLQTAESLVSFVLDVHSNCLVMRAGSGHLYALGSLTNIFDGQPRTPTAAGTSQRIRKIRIPNKRKCTSIAGCGGAMAFAVESGECFLHGRHIVNAHAEIYAAEGTAEGPRAARPFSPQVGSSRSDSPSTAWCPNSLGHMFVKDVATICARCGCCSAKGRECPYAGRSSAAPLPANQTPVRPPIHRGAPCACGAGETACLRCGICRRCSQQQQPPASTSPIALVPDEDEEEAEEETSDEAEQLGNEAAAQEVPAPSADRTPRLATDAMLTAGRVVLTSEQNEIKVATVSVGNYHTILLCADHQVRIPALCNSVYRRRSSPSARTCAGQLGVGDTAKRTGPQRVNLPANLQVVQAVAGGNHCVLRTVNGEVLTFGAHRASQLGRKEANEAEDRFWFARPEFVAGFGPNGDRVATWIAARGDRTFVQSHRRLFTRRDLDSCGVAANRECVALIPTGRTEEDGGSPTNCALIPSRPWAFDPVYDVLWSFDADRLQVVGFSDAPRSSSAASEMTDVESTELCVPAVAAGDSDGAGAKFTDAQLAVFMLSTAYGLSLSALAVIPTALRGLSGTNKTATRMNTSANPSLVGGLDVAPSDGKPRSRGASLADAVASSCSVVGRFEAFGGGWGYSAHCVEAIEFRVNRDVALFGLGLFGGRGENTARVKIFRRPSAHDAASPEGEHQLELLAETPETLFECAAREVAFVGFPNGASASIAAHVWHVAWVQIHGTSSDCGAEGQAAIRADGDVEWRFRNSPLSNNGTDVESGQLPEFFYKVRPSFAANNPPGPFDASRLLVEPELADVSLSAQTVFAVTPAALRHLFRVLEWAIRGSFLLRDYDEMQDDQAATRQERAAFVAIITLRMIRIYFGVLFPGQSTQRYPAGGRDQMLESVECVVEFHSLLDRLFQVADEKLFFEDRIGALMVAEAVEVSVACSRLFLPTAAVLAVRLGDSIAKCERNWRLLAMLRSFCRLEGFVLPILGIQQNPPPSSLSVAETRRLAERFAAMVPEYARPATASGVIRFVFELAFAPMEAKPDDLLFDRLRSTAQDLVLRMAKQLVFHRTQTKQPPTIFQTPRRFRQVIAHADWETGQEHDAIAFKVDRAGVVLHGVGMFAAAQRAQRKAAYVIEVFESKGNTHGESWTLLSRTSGANDSHVISGQPEAADGSDQWTSHLRLSASLSLQSGVVYAVRVQSDVGKTRYGEGGVSSVRLQGSRNTRLTFLPCSSLSRNGTTVGRGQIPFLLYSIKDEQPKAKRSRKSGRAATIQEASQQQEETNRLFLLMVRLLSTKLSVLITSNALRDGADCRTTCSQMVALISVFISAHPHSAFEVVAAFDGVLPLISAANADVAENAAADEASGEAQRKASFGSMVNDQSACSTRTTGRIQAVVESAHPYAPHSLQTHVVRFDRHVEFVCVRFHDECQTAHSEDALWVYGQLGDEGTGSTAALYTVGRFSVAKEWPDGVLLVPGRAVWFVFESGAARDEMDVAKQYGFRCTVDGISAAHSVRGSVSIASLEQEFAWLCSTACDLIVRSTLRKDEEAGGRKRPIDRECQDLIQRHGALLQKGLNLTAVPTLAQLNKTGTPQLESSDSLQFLADFISASSETDGGLLARALIVDPFVDVARCRTEVDGGEFAVGRPVNLKVDLRTQFDDRVLKAPAELQVEFVVRRGALATRSLVRTDSARILRSLTVFNDLVASNNPAGDEKAAEEEDEWRRLRELQMNEEYRPLTINQSRFIAITAQPPFVAHSLEEMRWAFELGNATTEVLKLPTNATHTTWTPSSPGRYHVEVRVDGFACAHRVDFNVRPATPAPPSALAALVVPPTPVHRPRQRNLSAVDNSGQQSPFGRSNARAQGPLATLINRATCPTVSAYAGARIRSHPTLSATIVGGLPRGATIKYVETQRNGDGVWLRLSDDVRSLYVDRLAGAECAWVLQFNRHLKMEHLKLQVVNGNNVDDESKEAADDSRVPAATLHPTTPQRRTRQPSGSTIAEEVDAEEDDEGNTPTDVLRPLTVDCFRAVFAAFVWHEQLVSTLTDCIRELRASKAEGLTPTAAELRDSFYDSTPSAAFNTLQHARRLWAAISTALRGVVRQQLILPTPPARRSRMISARARTSDLLAVDASNDSPLHQGAQEDEGQAPIEEVCELCGEMHGRPITVHMRAAHPGCGGSCFGHGYNSAGGFSTGWTGVCGEGGRGNAIWYLLCPNCRTAALRQRRDAHGAAGEGRANGAAVEAADEEVERRWSEFRLLSSAQQLRPEVVMRRNAIFLLGLSPSQRAHSAESAKPRGVAASWTIDLHPTGGTLTPQSSVLSGGTATTSTHPPAHSAVVAQQSHTSDPGVSLAQPTASRVPTSLSASANVLRRPTANFLSTVGPLAEEEAEDEGILPFGLPGTSANARLAELPLRLSALIGSSPSAALRQHPVLAFVVENHDLRVVRRAFETAIRRAVALSYTFKLWTWLLKLVTAESSVMDIVWQFLTTMRSLVPFAQPTNIGDLHFATRLRLLPHPWRLCFLAGDLVNKQMVHGMHSFLQTLYIILRAEEVDIRLKCLCFRAWTFQLTVCEQNLLYTLCKLLCSVCDVLADNSADNSVLLLDESLLPSTTRASGSRPPSAGVPLVKQMDNLSGAARISASSQRNLIRCLVDGSNETFWESGDEDMNHVSNLTVSWDPRLCTPTILALYVDQVRDSAYRLQQVIVTPGERLEESAELKSLHSTIVNPRFVGWIRCCTIGCSSLSITLKFNGRSCRVRQLLLLGYDHAPSTSERPPAHAPNAAVELPEGKSDRPTSAHQLSFTSAQMDAFALFQAVAAQARPAFSDEFAEEQNGTLRQQVLDMLFNRVQLQPLQSYVCTQMVTAVEREIVNLRDRKKRNFSYVCGLMVMLMKICESRKGLEVFSMRTGLLIMLSELLLFAPQIVQFQVVETIERLLKHFRPSTVDCATFVQNLLAVVAKTITLQIKDKISHKMSSASLLTFTTDIPNVWRADRPISAEVVQLVLRTLSSVANGAATAQWTSAVRVELANNVMALTKLLAAAGFLPPSASSTDVPSASFSTAEAAGGSVQRAAVFLRSPQFWLSVSALAAVGDPAWLEMSTVWRSLKARRSKEPEPLCENHDDGVTLARFHCEMCASFLCFECFTVLHLNKKKKGHAAKLVGSSNLCPQVNVHEGCTRLRLSNLLILFNCSKLSGIVELSAEMSTAAHAAAGGDPTGAPSASISVGEASGKCRFCSNALKSDAETQSGTCSYGECREFLKDACTKVLSCGHWCPGIRDEVQCLPCFQCPTADPRADGEDLCVVCFTDRLGGAPCVRLGCGHYFHFACVRTVLEKRWNGPRIVFRFMQCPLCKQMIEHPALESLLAPLRAIHEDVKRKAVLRLEYDGLLKSKPLTSPDSEYFENPAGYALDHYVYVLCSKCGKPYFGGESRCQEALESSTYDPDELICGACSDIAGAPVCGRHGTEFLEYKCKFCCSVAQRLMALPAHLLPKCPVGPRATPLEGAPQCPLRVQHPPTGQEFSLGCGICRNLTTF
ncbi:RCR-type E3 ubiquitin transferase [Aphelenchoides fujianensis]|nr:RCR-type E3 ubiquitin transferase [Aphelenchoides fujianensis]